LEEIVGVLEGVFVALQDFAGAALGELHGGLGWGKLCDSPFQHELRQNFAHFEERRKVKGGQAAGGGAVETGFESVSGELGHVRGAYAAESELGFDEFGVEGHGGFCFSGIGAGKARLGMDGVVVVSRSVGCDVLRDVWRTYGARNLFAIFPSPYGLG
jgi:hypothetical protein